MTRAARQAPAPSQTFASVSRSHTGGRELNEDRVLERSDVGLWAVADGMGGHRAGDVASAMVVEALGKVGPAGSAYALVQAVEAALGDANRRLIDYAAERGAEAVGSTVVALLAHEGHWACLWAGDSRAYLCRDRKVAQVTHDHSLVQELVDSGAMSPAEARRSRRRNVVTRGIGVDADLQLEMRQGAIAAGDVFLICSDGLSGVVEEAELAGALAREPSLEAAADALVELALRRGAPDNVTVVLVRAG